MADRGDTPRIDIALSNVHNRLRFENDFKISVDIFLFLGQILSYWSHKMHIVIH
jgi:hypothetical protein